MANEDSFRMVSIGLTVVMVAVAFYHRLQAAKSGEWISHREEGYFRTLLLRFVGVLTWLSLLVYLIDPGRMRWAEMPLPHWLRWTGAVLGVLGMLGTYWTLSSLGKNLTDTVVTRAQATLVTHGPYRWVRHPFYSMVALVMAAVTLLSANWFIGLLSVLVLTLLAFRTPLEEHYLIERFGQEYRDYASRTGRHFPRIFGPRCR